MMMVGSRDDEWE
uniref:Uncharacterized protein n=1 Tax=Anguilla anguilla TaxID=7936 RepID=A0A0E9QCH3_ANGAN